MMISPILLCSASVFLLAVIGIFLRRRSLLHVLIALELIFMSVNLNLVHFWTVNGRVSGAINILLILGLAAAEIAVALALILRCFHNGAKVSLDNISIVRE